MSKLKPKTTTIEVAELRRLRVQAKHDPIIDPIVELLDKSSRVMQTMSMRLDVMNFGQRQIERRLFQLERRAAKKGSTKRGGAR
jgi:hypothetical protein